MAPIIGLGQCSRVLNHAIIYKQVVIVSFIAPTIKCWLSVYVGHRLDNFREGGLSDNCGKFLCSNS